jgi:DNA-binding transcriptional ArsR family regulator
MSHEATNWAIKQRGLKPASKIVLWHLADCHNPAQGCFPAQAYLADVCEMSRSTLNEHLNLLEERGLIKRVRTIDGETKRRRPTRYLLAFETENSMSENRTRTQDADAVTQDVVGDVSGNRTWKAKKPCPEIGKTHVRKSDNNLVNKPVKRARAQAPAREGARERTCEGRPERMFFTADERFEASQVAEFIRDGRRVQIERVPKRVLRCLLAERMIDDATAQSLGISMERGQ